MSSGITANIESILNHSNHEQIPYTASLSRNN